MKPNQFFQAQFLGSKGSGRPSGSQKGSNRVGLTSKRFQIWVQSYNVLNKPDSNRVELGRVGPQGQNSGQIRVELVGFIWPH